MPEKQTILISVAVTDPDAETMARCRAIMKELTTRADFPTIWGEVGGGEGPVWDYTYRAGTEAAVVGLLHRELDRIDPDWANFLKVG